MSKIEKEQKGSTTKNEVFLIERRCREAEAKELFEEIDSRKEYNGKDI